MKEMKIWHLSFLLLISMILLISCSFGGKFSVDQAIQQGDVVNIHGQIRNLDQFTQFMKNVDDHVDTKLRIVQLTIEGDPIFYDLDYKNSKISYTFDESEDTFGGNKKMKTDCTGIVSEKVERGTAYKLAGCQSAEVGNSFQFQVRDADVVQTDTNAANMANAANTDASIRAIGTHSEGRLLIQPQTGASVETLGAPSCYGLEADSRWTGDYELLWEAKSDGSTMSVMTFPADFEIIQRDQSPANMKSFTIGDTTLFTYMPRYTDCHGLETYFFGVSQGKTFPITFKMNPDLTWANISQLPHRMYKLTDKELIVTGGYGAGQDFILAYHFQYDEKQRAMILQTTDRVKPSDMVYDE
jgi:hypothetical protein